MLMRVQGQVTNAVSTDQIVEKEKVPKTPSEVSPPQAQKKQSATTLPTVPRPPLIVHPKVYLFQWRGGHLCSRQRSLLAVRMNSYDLANGRYALWTRDLVRQLHDLGERMIFVQRSCEVESNIQPEWH